MDIKTICESLIINNVPLEKIDIEQNIIKIEFDDVNKNRYRVVFKPFQAIKVITEDCCDKSILLTKSDFQFGCYKRHILEVINSEWIESLRAILKNNDEEANFLNKARHFILDLRDNIVEIIAWNIEITQINNN